MDAYRYMPPTHAGAIARTNIDRRRPKLRATFWLTMRETISSFYNFFNKGVPISSKYHFLGGLSLHLNHLIASCVTNYDWPFGTLPFGLFGSNLDTRDLETYPRTYF